MYPWLFQRQRLHSQAKSIFYPIEQSSRKTSRNNIHGCAVIIELNFEPFTIEYVDPDK